MRKSTFEGRPSIGGAPQRVFRESERGNQRNVPRISAIGRPSTVGGSSNNNPRASTFGSFSTGAKMGRPSSGIGVRGKTDVIKDTRPIFEKRYQTACIKQLLEFLISHGYPNPISSKLLELPSAKDFYKIFEFIVKQFWFHYKPAQKMEEDIPKVMKMIGYPFNISKTQLLSAGSPHTWPHLLAALVWIIETLPELSLTIEAHGEIDAIIFEEPSESSESDAVSLEKIRVDDIAKTYAAFMNGEDMFEEQNKCLEKILMLRLNGGNVQDLVAENMMLEEDLKLMEQAEQKKNTVQQQIDICKHDFKLLSAHVSELRDYRKNLETQVYASKEEIETLRGNHKLLLEKQASLQNAYEKQGISQAEVDRLKSEQEGLRQDVEQLEKQIANIDSDIWESSIKQAKINEEIENEARTYNRLAIGLKLVPETTELANGRDFHLYTGVNSDPISDFEKKVKPMLLSLKKSNQDDIRKKEKLLFQLKWEDEKLSETLNERKEEVEAMEKELLSIDEEIETLKKMEQLDKVSFANEVSNVQQYIKQLIEAKKRLEEENTKLLEELNKCIERANIKKDEVEQMLLSQEAEYNRLSNEAANYKKYINDQLDIYIAQMKEKLNLKLAGIEKFKDECREREIRLDL